MAGICLTLGKRREIERLYAEDMRPSEIARAVGVTTATIYRELKRGETGELDKHFRPAYSAEAAERAVRLSIRNRGREKVREINPKGDCNPSKRGSSHWAEQIIDP